MNGHKDDDWALRDLDLRGGEMALKDLEQLTGELEKLALLLKQETRSQARMVILQRVQEIMSRIGEGFR